MIQITIFSIGKTKEPWLEEALSMYEKRLTGKVRFVFSFAKDDTQLERWLEEEKNVILLDLQGKQVTSEEFCSYLFGVLEKSHPKIAFAIGGPEGFNKQTKEKYPKICLSKLTFTHQMARLVLVEQVFRSLEMRKGSQYHK